MKGIIIDYPRTTFVPTYKINQEVEIIGDFCQSYLIKFGNDHCTYETMIPKSCIAIIKGE